MPRGRKSKKRSNKKKNIFSVTWPGIQETEPGIQKTEPGIQETEPGIRETEPRVQETEPGIRETEPGIHETEPGIRETEPGIRETEPGIHETEPGIQEREKQSDHQTLNLLFSESSVLNMSRDTIRATSMDGTQTFMSRSSLTKTQTETQDGICSDQSLRNKKPCELTNQSHNKDAQQLKENVKSTTQADDETLLNVIESAFLVQAVQLLKGDNHFSQDGLDRALISACRHGLKFLVQELVCLEANVQVKDQLGNTPLLICAESGFVDIVRFLLKMKADVNASNCAGDTALTLSMIPAGSLEMVRVLLDQSEIDINHQNRNGYTALMRAVEVMDVDVIKILMDSYKKKKTVGAFKKVSNPRCVESINSKGMTAQEIADKCGLGNIYNILKTHTKTRLSLLDTVIERKDTESLNILLNCHFVEKQDIQTSFVNIFKNVNLKENKTFTEKEIMIIKRLLKYGAEVDTSWYGGSMSVAVKMGDYGLVQLLCQHLQQRLEHRSKAVSLALIAASTSGRCDLIKLLLKYNPDINNNCYFDSPLDCALSHGHLESAKLLIQHGAKMDIGTAFESAVTQQLPEYMNFVFENYQPEVISYAGKGGGELNRLLVSASKGGNLEIIGRLLDAGADVNYEKYRETPLGESKDGDVARFLIRRGANVNLLIDGTKPLLLHILKDENMRGFLNIQDKNMRGCINIEVVKVLLENGASVNVTENEGRTPLMMAASTPANVALLQFLLDNGADINSQDKRGYTALMEAVVWGCPLNVSFLLEFHKEKSISLNVQSNEGQTALFFCRNPEIANQVIDFGADVNIKDMKGNTPLMFVLTTSYSPEKILTTLIKAGSDVNCQNNEGLSPLMLAARNYLKDAIIILLDSGADVNALNAKDNTKTALSFLSDYRDHNFKFCIEAFLAKGASSSYIDKDLLHRMIVAGKIDVVPGLIKSGLGPADVESQLAMLGIIIPNEIPTVSPLCISLLRGNASLARYFVGNLFLTNSDVTSLPRNKILHQFLEKWQHQACLNFLEEFSSQPFSLFQLAFVTVTSAVVSSPGREDRVNMLPLPQAIKEKLLFKSQEIQLDVSTTDLACFRQDQRFSSVDIFDANIYNYSECSADDDYDCDDDNLNNYDSDLEMS